jgi:hypothetical protein
MDKLRWGIPMGEGGRLPCTPPMIGGIPNTTTRTYVLS